MADSVNDDMTQNSGPDDVVDSTQKPKKGSTSGRGKGNTSYSANDLTLLLDLAEHILPLCFPEWQQVASSYQ